MGFVHLCNVHSRSEPSSSLSLQQDAEVLLLCCLLPVQTQVGISKARAARRDAAAESSQGQKKKKKDKQPKQEGNSLVLNPVYFNFISLTLPGGFQRPAQADFNLPISGLIRNTHH